MFNLYIHKIIHKKIHQTPFKANNEGVELWWWLSFEFLFSIFYLLFSLIVYLRCAITLKSNLWASLRDSELNQVFLNSLERINVKIDRRVFIHFVSWSELVRRISCPVLVIRQPKHKKPCPTATQSTLVKTLGVCCVDWNGVNCEITIRMQTLNVKRD